PGPALRRRRAPAQHDQRGLLSRPRMPKVTERRRDLPGGADLLVAGPEREAADARAPRWLWRVAGLLAIVLVAVLVVPGLLSGPHQRPRPAADVRPSPPANVVGPNL